MRARETARWSRRSAGLARLTPWVGAGVLLLMAAACSSDKSGRAKPIQVGSFTNGDASNGDDLDAEVRGGSGGRGGMSGANGASGKNGGASAAATGSRAGNGSGGLDTSGNMIAGPAAAGGGGGAKAAGAGSGNPIGYVAMPFTQTVECEMCQKRRPVCVARRNACVNATATAAAGPKAGAQQSQLCRDTLACLYNSNCADLMADGLACLCGVGVTLEQCVSNGAVGLCAGELEASAETIVPLDISTRLGDPVYAAGLAFRALQCAERYCAKSCGLCASSNPMCVDVEPGMEPAP